MLRLFYLFFIININAYAFENPKKLRKLYIKNAIGYAGYNFKGTNAVFEYNSGIGEKSLNHFIDSSFGFFNTNAIYFINNNFALSGSITFISGKLNITYKSIDDNSNYSASRSVYFGTPVTFILQYHLHNKSFTPYIGLGYSYTISNIELLNDSSCPVFQLGINYNIRNNLDLNSEFTYFVKSKHEFKLQDISLTLRDTLSISSYHISIGLNVKL